MERGPIAVHRIFSKNKKANRYQQVKYRKICGRRGGRSYVSEPMFHS
jgi:hypothetical protein